jgi:hypothetical protein
MRTEIHDAASLKAAIAELQERQMIEKQQLTEDFHAFTESLKPMNLIKSSFNKVTTTPGFGGNVLSAAMSVGAGLLSKNLLVGSSNTILKRVAGHAVKAGVTGIVAKKADKIKYAGLKLLTKIIGRKNPPKVY